MKITGAECLLKKLKKLGTKEIFGYPGGNVLPLYDALLKENGIEHILVRSEQSGAHAAAAMGKITGLPGICVATSGPGATNLVTGIATAYMDSAPMIAITGQVSLPFIGTDAFQEADITGITLPIVKHSYLVKDVKELPRIVDEAWHIASTGRKGPVLIDIPRNVFEGIVDYDDTKEYKEIKIKGYKPTYEGHNSQIKKAAKMINASKKPVVWAGGGVVASEGEEILRKFVKKGSLPVVNTLMGLGTIDRNDHLSLGMIGLHGLPAGNLAVHSSDLIICIGARFDDRSIGHRPSFAKNAKVIHIDIDPAEIGKNIGADLPIVGDCKQVLEEMIDLIEKKDRSSWLGEIKSFEKNVVRKQNKTSLNPQVVIEKLSEMMRDDIVIATDVGQHQMFTAQNFKFKNGKQLLTSGGLGTMGYGLPGAVGGAFAYGKEKNIVAITGDGSFQMNMAEMATIVEHDLPVKILLFNNSTLCLVRQLQDNQCDGRRSGITFTGNPDFTVLAGAYEGMKTYKILKEGDIEGVLKEAFSDKKPAFIECIVGNEDNVYPTVPSKKALNEMIGIEK